MLKQTLLGTALAVALALPAVAQDVAPDIRGRANPNDSNVQTPDNMGAGRSMGSPESGNLTRPADPNRQPTGPSSQAQPEDKGNAAANVQTGASQAQGGTPPMAQRPGGAGQGNAEQAQQRPAQAQQGQQQTQDKGPSGTGAGDMGRVEVVPGRGNDTAAGRTNAQGRDEGIVTNVDRNADRARTVAGTVGGGRLAEDQVGTEDLTSFTVVGKDGKEIGSVSELWINTQSGRVDGMAVSAGGMLGVGDKLYGIDWQQVQAVDKPGKRVQLTVNEDDLRSDRVER